MRNLKREVREAEGNRPPFPGVRFQDKRRHVSAPTPQFLPKVSLLWALPPGALPPCLPFRLEPQRDFLRDCSLERLDSSSSLNPYLNFIVNSNSRILFWR